MPRRNRRRDVAAHAASREERTQVFSRTKMCKFHILGECTKGDSCHFAHIREDLETLPDLYRTKLCKTLINKGKCDDPTCRYAHNREEMRVVPGFNTALATMQNGVGTTLPTAGGQYDADRVAPVSPGLQPRPQPMPQPKQQAQTQQGPQFPKAPQPSTSQQGQAQRVGAPQPLQLSAMMQEGHVWQPLLGQQMTGMSGMNNSVQAAALQQLGMDIVAQASAMQFGQQTQERQQQDFMAQAAALQMGQAAQAHAAEALRLQAMAARLASQQQPGFSGGASPAANAAHAAPTSLGGYHTAGGAQPVANPEASAPSTSGAGFQVGRSRSKEGGSSSIHEVQQYQTSKEARSGLGVPGRKGRAAQFASGRDDGGVAADGPEVVVKNTFLSVREDHGSNPSLSSLRPVKTCSARLVSLVPGIDMDESEDGCDGDGLQNSPNVPVQINPGSLRSLSSNDLAAMDSSAEDPTSASATPERIVGEKEAFDGRADDQLNWKVRNTFVDVDCPYTPVVSHGGLRPIHSAAGRLDALTPQSPPARGPPGGLDLVPEDKGLFLRQESSQSQAAEATEKRSQDTPLKPTAEQQPVLAGSGNIQAKDVPANGSAADAKARPSPPVREHPLLPKTSGFHVKNTFLDFDCEEERPQPMLRQIHTAGGRLDLMGLGEE